MNLQDIQASITQMSDDELEELISKVRNQRGAKPIKVMQKAKDLTATMESMSAEELAAMVAKMEGKK